MPLPDGYTEDDLKGLSESEKKILMGDGEEDDENALEELAGGADEEEGDEGEGSGKGDKDGEEDEGDDAAGKDDKGGKGTDTGAGKDGAEGKGKPAGKAADAVEDDEDDDTGLKFEALTPKDAEEQRTKLQTEKDEAFDKLMAGEIEPEAYRKTEKRVNDALQELLTATITDSVTSTLTQAQVKQQWDGAVKQVVKAAKEAGLDYKADKDLQAEFDGMVRVYGGIAATKGMTDENGLKASKWALQQAHETMMTKHGKTAAADAGDGKGKGKESKAGKAADLSGIPPSLRGAPQAATATGGDDEFAHIDALKGIDKEKALAKLTPEQQDRYLA